MVASTRFCTNTGRTTRTDISSMLPLLMSSFAIASSATWFCSGNTCWCDPFIVKINKLEYKCTISFKYYSFICHVSMQVVAFAPMLVQGYKPRATHNCSCLAFLLCVKSDIIQWTFTDCTVVTCNSYLTSHAWSSLFQKITAANYRCKSSNFIHL